MTRHDPTSGPPATVVIADPAIDTERLLFQGVDTDNGPRFSIGEVTKVFFSRSPQWLRDLENQGYFIIEGEGPIIRRREGKYARYYTLSDIELVAHALAFRGRITGRKLRAILTALRSIGQIWGYF